MYEIFMIIWRNKRAFVGLLFVLMFVALGILSLEIAPFEKIRYEGSDVPFSLEHPLATDPLGRDMFVLLSNGAAKILLISLLVGLITTGVGSTLGILAGYKGGKVDAGLMVLTDIVLNIPGLPLYIAIAAYFQQVPELAYNPLIIASVLSITGWAGLARAIRGQVLSIKRQPFIEAAKCLGLPTYYIVFSEIAPNIMGYIAINFIFNATGAVYAIIGLYFLGILPVDPTNWGMMLNVVYNTSGAFLSPKTYYLLVAPLLAIVLLQEGFIMFTHALEEVFNPRIRSEYYKKFKKPVKKR